MQFELPFLKRRAPGAGELWLEIGGRKVRLEIMRNARARRYVLRVKDNGEPRVTVPRGGSTSEALGFVRRNGPWLERQWLRQAAKPKPNQCWTVGTEFLFRGEKVRIETDAQAGPGVVRFGPERVAVGNLEEDLRPAIERWLRFVATHELSARTVELAKSHGCAIQRVMVRNQRSRWGSCSRRGTISLNWRLIQAPAFVRDYIILHELAHLKEMNHSRRFWAEVARLCPDYEAAERWLKANGGLLKQA